MDEGSSQDEVTIFDKDESAEHAINIVGGFVIEESQKPFPNGKLSFVPEEYGKKETPPQPPSRPSRSKASTMPKEDPSLPPGMAKCEFCGTVAEGETFLAPSRRFCTVTCCKRYSAEKRYYPYGRDEEGVAMSIRQGLVNKHRSLRPNSKPKKGQQQTVREERQRRLAYYKKSGTGEATPSTTPRGGRKGGKKNPASAGSTPAASSSATRVMSSDQTPGVQSYIEPYSHPHGTPLAQWTVEDVSDFLIHLGYEAYVDKFTEHEIDGRALSLVQDHHLLMTLKLRLGPTLKITEHISMLKNMEEISE